MNCNWLKSLQNAAIKLRMIQVDVCLPLLLICHNHLWAFMEINKETVIEVCYPQIYDRKGRWAPGEALISLMTNINFDQSLTDGRLDPC
jgi:hypothetical protein